MLGTLTTLASFAFVLGVLVFVHELGHFLAAKRVGIRVLKFQLGFNPTIFSFRRGDTEYGIGAVPLGGYVKMAGENPEDTRSGASDEFLSKGKWQRFQVLVMGPIMNLLLAVILTAVVLYQGAESSAFRRSAADRRRGGRWIAGGEGRHPARAIASCPSRDTRSTPGWISTWRSARPDSSEPRDSDRSLVRNGLELTRLVTPVTHAGQRSAASRSATSACCPTSTRTSSR